MRMRIRKLEKFGQTHERYSDHLSNNTDRLVTKYTEHVAPFYRKTIPSFHNTSFIGEFH